jgi:hypothetical protein
LLATDNGNIVDYHCDAGNPHGDVTGDSSDCDVESCAISYAMRHDTSRTLHDYCFAIDRRLGVKASCKAFEYLLKNPHVGFYDTVLRLRQMPWQLDATDGRIAIGSLVHDFLQIFPAGSGFVPRSSVEIFHENIGTRSRKIKSLMAKACAAADAEIPTDFYRIVDIATILAKRLVERLFAIANWKSFRSEYNLPSDVIAKIGESEIKLSGRLDFLVSSARVDDSNKLAADATIIDFKTGNDIELTEKNLHWHMEKYANLQLFLYGIALETLGFERVKIMILKPDSGELNSAIPMNYVICQATDLMKKLEQTIKSGLIERQIFGKSFRKYFVANVPLATTDLY